jgi:hypothetical protein
MRNPIACVSCRAAKRQVSFPLSFRVSMTDMGVSGANLVQCIHDDRPPCKRCKDRAEQCVFPPPGTSSFHRQPKIRHVASRYQYSDVKDEDDSVGPMIPKEPPQRMTKEIDFSPYDLSDTDPYDLFTDDVKNSYLRCAYKWSFSHISTLLEDVRNKRLDSGVIWAILALAIR